MAMEHNILMALFSSQGSIDYPADFQVCLQYNLVCFKSNTAYFNNFTANSSAMLACSLTHDENR